MCVVGWEEPLPSRGAGTGLSVIGKACRNACVAELLAGHFRALMPWFLGKYIGEQKWVKAKEEHQGDVPERHAGDWRVMGASLSNAI